MGNTVNVPGSAQPAAARCVPCLSHHRIDILRPRNPVAGLQPQDPTPPPCLPLSQLCGQGEAFQFPSLRAELCLPQPDRQGTDAGGWHEATDGCHIVTPALLPIQF